MSLPIIQSLAAQVADHKGYRLLHLEVPRVVYDKLMAEHRAEQVRITRGLRPGEFLWPCRGPQAEPDDATVRHTIFEVCGVRISKADAPVSTAMREAGRRVLDSHTGLDAAEMATRIYRAMVDQAESEQVRP